MIEKDRKTRPTRGHGPSFARPVEKAKDFKGTLKRLVQYLSPYKFLLIIVIITAIFSTVFSIVGPKIMGDGITKVFEGLIKNGKPNFNYEIDYQYFFWNIIALLIGLYLISALFAYVQQYIMASVSQKTVYSLRRDINNKLARLPLKYFDSKTHGEILSRITNDVEMISTTLSQSITQIITAVVMLVGIIVMMLTISWELTIIVVLTLPLSLLISIPILKASQKFFKGQQKALGELSGHVEEMYTGHKIVKAFGHEDESIKKFKDINEKLYKSGWKAQFITGIIMPIMTFVNNLGYVFVSIVGAYLVIHGRLKIGYIQSFISYTRQFAQPIRQTANISNVLQLTIAASERVFELLDEEELITETNSPKIFLTDKGFVMDVDGEIKINNESKVIFTNLGYVLLDASLDHNDFDLVNVNEIKNEKIIGKLIAYPNGFVNFNNVDFSYKEDTPLIEKMNIEVKPGHTIAIVGPTGAGKTTIVNLLMRFYEINKGSISIDGIDIKDMKRVDLRSVFGMVLQDTWLFNGKIKDNIAYGRLNASDQEIINASKVAEADHFIRTLPDGYDTVLNEEASNISLGQKQLLTIARAVLADPAILILDEATSSVDTRTEIHIQKAMKKLMKGRTNFVIAHRLSTIKNADLILVMNYGKIIEKGTHIELLEAKGFYADLYNSQFVNENLSEAI